PKSVMAHTNKSMFLMRLGKIQEAEEEKSKATVKSFAAYGEEAKQKKAEAERVKKEREDQDRRASMFRQVLDIDAEDSIALFGLGDIALERGELKEAREYL